MAEVKWGLGLGLNNEISQVADGSVAATAGVELGYILTHVNESPVGILPAQAIEDVDTAGVLGAA